VRRAARAVTSLNKQVHLGWRQNSEPGARVFHSSPADRTLAITLAGYIVIVDVSEVSVFEGKIFCTG
jgi:hypothetical protein